MVISSVQYNNVQYLAKYATGTAMNHAPTAGDAAKEGLGFAAFSGGAWVLRNRKNLRGAWEAVKASDVAAKGIMKEATAGGKTIKNIWNGAGKIVESRAAAEATAEAASAGAKATKGFWGKFFTKAGGGVAMGAFDFATGTFTDVIPAFKLGTKQGFKQLGKTTVKAAATGVGWWAGSAIGTKAGAAIGTAICPGIGTAVGAVVGFLGGCLGSWLCNKAVDKVLGPSEIEKAQKEAAQQATDQVAQTGEGAEEIAGVAYETLIQNYINNGGKLSKEDEKAKQSLEGLLNERIDLAEAAKEYQEAQAAAAGAQTAQQAPAQAQAPTQTQQPVAQVTPQGAKATATEEEKEEEKKKQQKKESLSQTFGSITAQASMAYPMAPQNMYAAPTAGMPTYGLPVKAPQFIF